MAASTKKAYLAKRVKTGKSAQLERSARPPIQCPQCRSGHTWKDGLRYTKKVEIQRYLCRSCGYRFSKAAVELNIPRQILEMPNSEYSQPHKRILGGNFPCQKATNHLPLSRSEKTGSHLTSRVTESETLNILCCDSSNAKVCVSEREAKNLVEVESRLEKAAGATWEQANAEVIVELQKFALWLQDEGIKQSSINTYTMILLTLVKHGAVLNQPETVRRVLGQQASWKESYKHTIADIYSKYLDKIGLKWRKPRYQETNELIFIPSQKELQLAVNCGSRENRMFAQFIYEVGCRLNEAEAFRWIDIDREKRLVDIQKSKNGNPRRLKVSSELIDILLSLPKNHETVFTPKAQGTRGIMFHKRMQTLARKSNNPKFLKIHLHTLRHVKALRAYHKTRDILHVRYVLGHKTLRATQRYVEMYKNVYGNLKPQDYVVKIARTSEEAKDLLKVGFEFVNEINGEYLYRKVPDY